MLLSFLPLTGPRTFTLCLLEDSLLLMMRGPKGKAFPEFFLLPPVFSLFPLTFQRPVF